MHSGSALIRAFVAAQIAETVANYQLADDPLEHRGSDSQDQLGSYGESYRDEGSFWRRLSNGWREERPIHPIIIESAALSEWVARVPGLYWLPGSERLRKLALANIEHQDSRWRTYRPPGKSQKVSGGVGTLRFPPAHDGFRLVTLTTTLNASAGVPALISPEIWGRYRLTEGCIIDRAVAFWRDLPREWAAEFPAVQGIPRGCLQIQSEHLHSGGFADAPILIHPFSIMEYWDGTARLDDFVYATADTSDRFFRRTIEAFFETYRKDKQRDGVYLLASDVSDPLWEAVFASPREMRLGGPEQLRIIEARVREAATGTQVVETLIRRLSQLDHQVDLKRLSFNVGLDSHRWSRGGRLADEVARLVAAAIESGKQDALLHAATLELAI